MILRNLNKDYFTRTNVTNNGWVKSLKNTSTAQCYEKCVFDLCEMFQHSSLNNCIIFEKKMFGKRFRGEPAVPGELVCTYSIAN